MNSFKTIIVDDERLAREEVKRALADFPDFEVVGEAANVDAALKVIAAKKPDLIFLDIHMPQKSGFDLLDELNTVPEVVFTTAYDQYAVQAFEVNALDYLMKPLRKERFAKTITKVKDELSKRVEETTPFSIHKKIFIKDGEKCYFIPLSEINLIESLDNYARLHFGGKQAMIKRSLNALEEKLNPFIFFRINRSQIINLEYIQEIHPYFNNSLQIKLLTGEELKVSTRQSVAFKRMNGL